MSAPRTIIGRESGDLPLEDAEASAVHAEIDCTTGHVIVRDLGSSNGTWRSGKRLPQFALFEGQSFVCGTTEIFLVRIDGGANAPRPGQTAMGLRSDELGDKKQTLMGMPGSASSSTQPAAATSWQPPSTEGPLFGQEPPSITETLPPREDAMTAQMRRPLESTDTTAVPRLGQPAPSFVTDSSEFESHRTIPRGSREDITKAQPPASSGQTSPSLPQPDIEPSTTARASVVLDDDSATKPLQRASTEPPRSESEPLAATRADDVFRAPVANAVIKDPAAVRDKAEPSKAAPTARRRPWKRWLAAGGLAALAAGAAFGIVYLVITLVSGRGMNFLELAAEELPEQSVAVVAVSSPSDVIALFGDSASEGIRDKASQRLSFDPWSVDAWAELGVDPQAPVSVGIIDAQNEVVAVSVGVADRPALEAALAKNLLGLGGQGQELTWSDRTYGDYEGRFLDKPVAAAVVYRGDRATLVVSMDPPSYRDDGSADPEAIDAAVELLTQSRDKATLAHRDGFRGLVPPPGQVVLASYVDAASLRSSIDGSGVVQMAMRMALSDVDGFAGFVSHDDAEIHATYEIMVREGGRPDEYIRNAERKTAALDRIPAPVLAAFDGAIDPETLDRNLGGLASVGVDWDFIAKSFSESFGVDLRQDIVSNLGGGYGAALLKLPSERGQDDYGAIAWVELADEAKAKEVAEKIYAKANEQFGTTANTVGDVTVYETASVPAAMYIHSGHLWVTLGDVDEQALVADVVAGFAKDADPKVAKTLRKGGLAAGFVDIAGLVEAATPLLTDGDRKDLEHAEPVVSLLESVTLRAEVKKQTLVVRATLHTSPESGLPGLVQETTKLVGEQYAESLAAAARAQKCQQLAEHVMKLTQEELERRGEPANSAWDLERQALEDCDNPAMSLEQLDCYLGAADLKAFSACDQVGRSTSSDTSDAVVDEPDPKPVAYVEDIWPDTQDDADSEKPQPTVNYAVDLGRDPQIRGSSRALVTIVEFGDFECQYCRRSTSVVDEVLSKHGDDVRLVFRHNPLPTHPSARIAARAAIAAGRQGKFWPMHDKLFDNQGTLSEENFRKWAEELGMDMVKFDRDYFDSAVDRQIQRDLEAAEKFGASGTPVFFVNGRYLPGAQPVGAFDKLIEEELARAKTFVERRGNTRKGLYEDMLTHFAPEVIKPTTAPDLPDPDEKRYIVSTADLPRKGATTFARVQMVECGDFDCPFCLRARKTIDELLDAYPKQIAFYWAHNPLSFHAGAEPAARAAAAAAKQDKFWEMHDLLFEDPDSRDESDFIGMARRLSLDIPQFKTDLASEEAKKLVSDQQELCRDNEAQGTPTFFINGRRIAGAKPLEHFKAMIDAELAAGI